MHEYLTGSAKYKKQLPFYVDDLFSQDDIKELRALIEENRKLEPFVIADRVEDGHIHHYPIGSGIAKKCYFFSFFYF